MFQELLSLIIFLPKAFGTHDFYRDLLLAITWPSCVDILPAMRRPTLARKQVKRLAIVRNSCIAKLSMQPMMNATKTTTDVFVSSILLLGCIFSVAVLQEKSWGGQSR